MLRWLYVIAAALTVLFAADVLGGRGKLGVSSTAFTTEAAFSYRMTGAARCALRKMASHQWRDGARTSIADSQAIEADLTDADIVDGDNDPRSETTFDSTISIRGNAVRHPSGVASRGEAQSDTSRFAIEGGLPRGPPIGATAI